MFGSDFKRFREDREKDEETEKNESKSIIESPKPTYQNSTDLKKEDQPVSDYNYTIKTLLFFENKDYLTKFDAYFNTRNKFIKDTLDTIGMNTETIYGNYEEKKICLSLNIINNEQRFKNMLDVFIMGAQITLIFYDSDNPNYINKIKDLINIINSKTDTKFVVITDKTSENQESIKKLQTDELIQGIFELNNESDGDKLVKEIIETGIVEI